MQRLPLLVLCRWLLLVSPLVSLFFLHQAASDAGAGSIDREIRSADADQPLHADLSTGTRELRERLQNAELLLGEARAEVGRLRTALEAATEHGATAGFPPRPPPSAGFNKGETADEERARLARERRGRHWWADLATVERLALEQSQLLPSAAASESHPPLAAGEYPCGRFERHPHTDIFMHDLETFAQRAKDDGECCRMCLEARGCGGWTMEGDHGCYLKMPVESTSASLQDKEGVRSGTLLPAAAAAAASRNTSATNRIASVQADLRDVVPYFVKPPCVAYADVGEGEWLGKTWVPGLCNPTSEWMSGSDIHPIRVLLMGDSQSVRMRQAGIKLLGCDKALPMPNFCSHFNDSLPDICEGDGGPNANPDKSAASSCHGRGVRRFERIHITRPMDTRIVTATYPTSAQNIFLRWFEPKENRPDLVLFNTGLHPQRDGGMTPGLYGRRLDEYVRLLRTHLGNGTALVWLHTTAASVPKQPEKWRDITSNLKTQVFNGVAEEIMRKHDVHVVDAFRISQREGYTLHTDGVHMQNSYYVRVLELVLSVFFERRKRGLPL